MSTNVKAVNQALQNLGINKCLRLNTHSIKNLQSSFGGKVGCAFGDHFIAGDCTNTILKGLKSNLEGVLLLLSDFLTDCPPSMDEVMSNDPLPSTQLNNETSLSSSPALSLIKKEEAQTLSAEFLQLIFVVVAIVIFSLSFCFSKKKELPSPPKPSFFSDPEDEGYLADDEREKAPEQKAIKPLRRTQSEPILFVSNLENNQAKKPTKQDIKQARKLFFKAYKNTPFKLYSGISDDMSLEQIIDHGLGRSHKNKRGCLGVLTNYSGHRTATLLEHQELMTIHTEGPFWNKNHRASLTEKGRKFTSQSSLSN